MKHKTLYHGSLSIVEHPLVHVGRKDLDFGQGFYLTEIEQQAVSWAHVLQGRRKTEHPAYINVYELKDEEAIRKQYVWKTFSAYDHEWLEFIVASRHGQVPWKDYDVIEGGIANDSVIDTIDAYMSGLITADIALGQLAYRKPNHQICILNQQIVETYLNHIRTETV